MPRFTETQDSFAEAVRRADHALPQGVTSHSADQPTRRFNVYRNNFYASLIDVVAGRYPVVQRLVGEEFFRAMAKVYVEQEPPRSAMILAYGSGFPDFLAGFPPVADVPYLPDVARMEWARHTAYHAADATPLRAEDFAGVLAEQVAALTLSLHPSLTIVPSPYPIVSIWETNTFDEEVRPVSPEAQDAMIARPEMTVEVRRLPPGAAAFITALSSGKTLDEAATQAASADERFDLAGNIAGLIDAGVIVGYRN
ncbi:DNA-binding domain-containing protein [Dichotomicrobium thermohalophilum]|uniref:Putative DNA-binding domain-containing protein n=1 Tax=Dichotomicrobium thermohalophilum TaxID=933063 RepID=A0A397Q388_9HYPH|nr:putative DNA-binding domain-containing protein [Dichotomicrobium thermohalophilum]RIA55592.1 hypothetical protein BXY53_0662 [Dichotomicrobium thermohalophilum]